MVDFLHLSLPSLVIFIVLPSPIPIFSSIPLSPFPVLSFSVIPFSPLPAFFLVFLSHSLLFFWYSSLSSLPASLKGFAVILLWLHVAYLSAPSFFMVHLSPSLTCFQVTNMHSFGQQLVPPMLKFRVLFQRLFPVICYSFSPFFCVQGIKPHLTGLLSMYKIHCPNLVTMAASSSTKVYVSEI